MAASKRTPQRKDSEPSVSPTELPKLDVGGAAPDHIGQNGSQNGSVTGDTRTPDQEAKELPQIVISGPLRKQSQKALQAMGRANAVAPQVFTQDRYLARVRYTAEGEPIIEVLDVDRLRYTLERSAQFVRERIISLTAEKRYLASAPPIDVVKDILAMPKWRGFPPIDAVTHAPVLRPDGSILTTPGYDPATRLYYEPGDLHISDIPPQPTQQDAMEARAMLDDVLGEFPYDSDASRANLYALLLTLVVRQVIEGCVPVAGVGAPVMGTGKSLLLKVLSLIAFGRVIDFTTAPTEEPEWRKKITSLLAEGRPLIVFDNLTGPLSSGELSAAVTAPTWTDRLLGHNTLITVRQRSIFVVTGNNLLVGGDMPRRLYRVQLDADVERPYLRTGFRHPDLLKEVGARRGDLLAALLTVARSWYVAGCPRAPESPTLGSFEDWAEKLAGMLHYAGIRGFLGNQDRDLDLMDEEGQQWGAFLRAWYTTFGARPVTTTEVVQEIVSEASDPSALRAALPLVLLPDANEWSKGRLMRSLPNTLKGQVHIPRGPDQLRLARAGTVHGNLVAWAVSPRKQTSNMG